MGAVMKSGISRRMQIIGKIYGSICVPIIRDVNKASNGKTKTLTNKTKTKTVCLKTKTKTKTISQNQDSEHCKFNEANTLYCTLYYTPTTSSSSQSPEAYVFMIIMNE